MGSSIHPNPDQALRDAFASLDEARARIRHKDRVIARLKKEAVATFETKAEWLEHGRARGWVE